MSSLQLLEQLQEQVAKVERETVARAERVPLSDGEDESQWLGRVQHLKEGRQDVLAAEQKATRLVEQTEADLAQLEDALRAWLVTADGLENKSGVDERRRR